jgi:glycogen debranching enzyme
VDEDVIQIAEHFYIRATSSRADERTRVLKHGDTFGVFDRYGDVHQIGSGEQGLFHEGTRFLSRLEIRLGQGRTSIRPLLLSSSVNDANDVLAVDLTNPDITGQDGRIDLPRGVLHILRTKFIWKGCCHERLMISNYGLGSLAITMTVRFDADFVDIFEVRGSHREKRGRVLDPLVENGACTLGYEGLDGVIRRTTVELEPAPADLTRGTARYDIALDSQQSQSIFLAVSCQGTAVRHRSVARAHDDAYAGLANAIDGARGQAAEVFTGNQQLNRWIHRSAADLQMMITQTEHGLYPYAGVPWFSTVFGRDGIITALQMLWVNPQVARGVLAYLAATQADRSIPEKDAEPGKILHETRAGEMAALGEIPFGRYYGSVDSTPLFVMLAGAYYQRTADLAFLERIWPNIERALGWMEVAGDPDGDGFLEYARRSAHGLVQQGWKDSHDSVFYEDGTMAEPPIALCEVQGYAYAAWLAAAEIATVLGQRPRAEVLRARAHTLRDNFERAFWLPDLGTYALALDGKKRPCRVRSSNPGHCLYTGIADPAHARQVAETLLSDTGFSGWGIRTLAAGEPRYNPMSYHNGSVWPHDNALCAAGLARYGLRDEPVRVLEALFTAANFLDLQRMPELFCGFGRRAGEGPTLYPVACLPQAWASGSVFMLLQACLGMSIDTPGREVRFENPALPAWLPDVRITNLQVADGSVDLLLERHPHDVGVTVLRREGRIRIDVVK